MFTISQLAAAADAHVETVRYYQRRGLLQEPARPMGGIRRYGAADVSRLLFIRRAQSMGFTLEEISDLLKLQGARRCEDTRQLTELKLLDVRRRLGALQQLEQDLLHHIAECRHTHPGEACPTLDRLAQCGQPSEARSLANIAQAAR